MADGEYRFDCRTLPCILIRFQWGAQAGHVLEQSIVPNPTDDEHLLIDQALFGLGGLPPTDPFRLPDEINVLPCYSPCQCQRLRGNFGPAGPVAITKDVTLTDPQTGQQKTFAVTLAVPGTRVALKVGKCVIG